MAAKFNFEKFSEAVVTTAVDRTNSAIKKQESDYIIRIADCIDKMVMIASWTNRRWNLISSFVGVLFYNGKIVGKETEGAVVTARRRYYVNGKERRERTKLPNPFYSYYITGYERRPWRFAEIHDIFPRTGRGYAKKAVEAAQEVARTIEGYSAFIVIAMPYAESPRGGLVNKTKALLKVAAELQGKGFLKTIDLDTGLGAFDYDKSQW